MSQCQAHTKTGRRCPSHALPDSNYCFCHSPDRAQERIQANRRGGLNRRRHPNRHPFPAPDTNTGAGLIAFTDALIRAAWDNSLPANRLRALGALVQTQMKLLEVGNFERRLSEVERILELRPDIPPQQLSENARPASSSGTDFSCGPSYPMSPKEDP